MKRRIIGIIGAMPEEINGVVKQLRSPKTHVKGMRTYYEGDLYDIPVIVAFSRWGKVAATVTATTLIIEFGITELIFTGVAGAIHHDLTIGDIVVGSAFIQHDMDASPIIRKYELPLLGMTHLHNDKNRVDNAIENIRELLATSLLDTVGKESIIKFNISKPSVVSGTIASGDKFFSNNEDKLALLTELPEVVCVEMEGAAVAQVCYEHEIPYTVIRVISDAADDSAHVDFIEFIKEVASVYSVEIIKTMLSKMLK